MGVVIRTGRRSLRHAPPIAQGALTRRVRAYADELLKRQNAGMISGRALAMSLNDDGIMNPLGKQWSEKTVYRMLKHGKNLGLPFILRSRSEAAAQRPPDHRSKTAIRQARDHAANSYWSAICSEKIDALVTSRGSAPGFKERGL